LRKYSLAASRGFAAAASGVIAAGVAVLINTWTDGWAWPSGAGLCALVACQAAFEWRRAAAGEDKSVTSRHRLAIEQCCSVVRDSKFTGANRLPADGNVDVRQRFGRVEHAEIIGTSGDGR
jgi:hypothetical protein